MMLEDANKEAFGYYPSELKPKSKKTILAACELCGAFRVTTKQDYRTFCKSCSPLFGEAINGNKHYMFGKHLSEETRALITKNHADLKGEKHPNWLGGISFEPYCIKFNNEYKRAIRNRFTNKCFLCGKSAEDNGKNLDVHHVNYNKNCGCDDTKCICVPLCRSCHMKTNGNREYWQALIEKRLKGTIVGW